MSEKSITQIHAGRSLPTTALAGTDLNSGYMPVRRVFYFAGKPDVNRLQESLATALAQWPDFAGTIILHNGIASLARNDNGARFTVEKHAAPLPPFGIEQPLGLPAVFCDETISQTPDDGGPVFTVKISVYNNNHWILGTCNSHALCDGSGYWQLMQSWRDAFHGTELATIKSDFMRYSNPAAPTNITEIPAHLDVPPVPLMKQQIANSQVYRTKQLLLPHEKLEHIKTQINTELAPDWVSTQDALMALVWQTLAQLSLQQGANAEHDFPLANVINIRSRLGLKNYIGNMAYSVSSRASLGYIASASLATLAHQLRQDSQQVSDDNIHQHLAFMQQQLQQGHYTAGGYFTGFSLKTAKACVNGSGIMINNWSKFPAYAMDFSGKPLWFDLATIIPMHFAMVMPAPNGVVLRLFLPEPLLHTTMHALSLLTDK